VARTNWDNSQARFVRRYTPLDLDIASTLARAVDKMSSNCHPESSLQVCGPMQTYCSHTTCEPSEKTPCGQNVKKLERQSLLSKRSTSGMDNHQRQASHLLSTEYRVLSTEY
jgi:hypothetical protein